MENPSLKKIVASRTWAAAKPGQSANTDNVRNRRRMGVSPDDERSDWHNLQRNSREFRCRPRPVGVLTNSGTCTFAADRYPLLLIRLLRSRKSCSAADLWENHEVGETRDQ